MVTLKKCLVTRTSDDPDTYAALVVVEMPLLAFMTADAEDSHALTLRVSRLAADAVYWRLPDCVFCEVQPTVMDGELDGSSYLWCIKMTLQVDRSVAVTMEKSDAEWNF